MDLTDMRPELQLMLRCARNWPDEAADARTRELLAGPIDWEFLLRIAERHRMKPFLYWNLKDDRQRNVPRPVWEQLEARFMANARGNLLAMGRLLRLLTQFEGAGIPVIAFKGPVSTYHLYGTPGLREFADLDLLVDPDDVLRATQLLISCRLQPPAILNANQTNALVRFRNELAFDSLETPLHVDLHWRLLYQCFDPGMDYQVLRERSIEVDVEGRPVRTLSPADFLYYLGMRAAIDCWSSVYRLVDLAAGVKVMNPMDVEMSIKQAGEVGRRRVMDIGLVLAHELLGLSLPGSLRNECVSNRGARCLVRETSARLMNRPEFVPGLIGSKFIGFHALQRLSDRACILLWLPLSPGPGDIRLATLPESMFPLYRLLRAFRAPLKLVRSVRCSCSVGIG